MKNFETFFFLVLYSLFGKKILLHLCCYFQVFFYSSDIFKSAGLDETSREYAVIGTGCVNLGVNVIAVFTLKYFTRRFLVLLSCYGTVLSLLLLTLCSHYMVSFSIGKGHFISFYFKILMLF